MKIETDRLLLISCNFEMINCILAGDKEISKFLNVTLPEKWTENGAPAFLWTKERLTTHPEEEKWFTYLHIIKQGNILNGSCGYKGPPDENGVVEIGYEVSSSHRSKGLATEIAAALIKNAFNHPEVKKVVAHTLAEVNASGKILQKCGMKKVAEIEDPEDGLIWKWELERVSA